MRTPIPSPTRLDGELPAAFRAEVDSFLLSLEAENLAPKTRRGYGESVELLGRFLASRGMPTDRRAIRREHVEAFAADQVARWRPNTARNRYLALKRFFDWLANEGLIEASPMIRMRPPRVLEEPVPVLREEAVRALLRACEGKTLADRRDAALIRLLLDSGARRSEIAGSLSTRWTCATRRRPCSAKAAGRGSSGSVPAPLWRSIAISASDGFTGTPSDPSCGSVVVARWKVELSAASAKSANRASGIPTTTDPTFGGMTTRVPSIVGSSVSCWPARSLNTNHASLLRREMRASALHPRSGSADEGQDLRQRGRGSVSWRRHREGAMSGPDLDSAGEVVVRHQPVDQA